MIGPTNTHIQNSGPNKHKHSHETNYDNCNYLLRIDCQLLVCVSLLLTVETPQQIVGHFFFCKYLDAREGLISGIYSVWKIYGQFES